MKFKNIFALIVLIMPCSFVQASQKLVGKKAPLFNSQAVFPDGKIDDFNLKDCIGKDIVIYFYPMDNSSHCTIQAKKFRDEIGRLQAKDIMVVGISPDSIQSHKKFRDALALPYPLISDTDKKHSIAKKYKTNGWFFNKRATFLIDKKGIIFKVFDDVDIKNQVEDILKAFAQEK